MDWLAEVGGPRSGLYAGAAAALAAAAYARHAFARAARAGGPPVLHAARRARPRQLEAAPGRTRSRSGLPATADGHGLPVPDKMIASGGRSRERDR